MTDVNPLVGKSLSSVSHLKWSILAERKRRFIHLLFFPLKLEGNKYRSRRNHYTWTTCPVITQCSHFHRKIRSVLSSDAHWKTRIGHTQCAFGRHGCSRKPFTSDRFFGLNDSNFFQVHCIDEYDARTVRTHLVPMWNLLSKQVREESRWLTETHRGFLS